MNEKRLRVPIYIGQGDLADRVSDNHHQAAWIKRVQQMFTFTSTQNWLTVPGRRRTFWLGILTPTSRMAATRRRADKGFPKARSADLRTKSALLLSPRYGGSNVVDFRLLG